MFKRMHLRYRQMLMFMLLSITIMNLLELSRSARPTGTTALPAAFNMAPTDMATIPEPVKAVFAEQANLVDDDALALAGLHSFSLLEYSDGCTSYLAMLERRSDDHEEEDTFLVDTGVSGDDKVTGYGEICLFRKSNGLSDIEGHPFARIVETIPELRRNGLGTRRLRTMGTLAFKAYGQPLRSSPNLEPADIIVLEKLVKKGEAFKSRAFTGAVEYILAKVQR